MSTLYRITIKKIENTKVTAEVRVIHPDAGSDIGSKDFALQILLETGLIGRRYFDKLPIPKEEWEKLVKEHPLKEEYDMLQLYHDGRRLIITKEEADKRENVAYREKNNEELFRQYGLRTSGGGISDGQHYIRFDNEPLKVIEAANKIMVSKPVKRKLEKDLYTLEFEVANAAYLHHLREKMRYETAAFNLSSYYKPEIKVEEGEAVLLTYKDEKSDKFWQVAQEGTTLNITYGKTGTSGQKNVKAFDSLQKAEKERDKLINEKLGKGYTRAN
ncbi:WGR domain-containing protein [Flavobacterium sp. DGU11]|uniref:WGR domain-containing protein n=1 Tax=Flavobacterium arundinis TaxID=3139143 RepID=A0ABU9HXH3_9FLAO